MFRFYNKCLAQSPYITNGLTAGVLVAIGDGLAQKLEYDACVQKTQKWLNENPSSINQSVALQPFSQNFSTNRLIILSAWGGLFFSPYFTRLFKFLDSFPAIAAKTPRNIAIRVVSIYFIAQPLNFVLFPYKAITEHYFPVIHPTFPLIDQASHPSIYRSIRAHESHEHTSHHTISAGTLALVSEGGAIPVQLSDNHEPIEHTANQSTYETLKNQVILDWQTKLPNVLMRAAMVWGSWNTINMSLVPPQYRVVASSFVSVGWNTWLSLYAHAELEDESLNQSVDSTTSQSDVSSIVDKLPKQPLTSQ